MRRALRHHAASSHHQISRQAALDRCARLAESDARRLHVLPGPQQLRQGLREEGRSTLVPHVGVSDPWPWHGGDEATWQKEAGCRSAELARALRTPCALALADPF